MPLFLDKHTYSRTGTLLSRLIGFERFFVEHSSIFQYILIIESEKERKDAAKILYALDISNTPIIQIESIQDILRYRDGKPGIYLASPMIFDVGLRLEYLKTKLSVTISLIRPLSQRILTEKLLEL